MSEVFGLKKQNGEKMTYAGNNRVWFCDGCSKAFIWDYQSIIFASEKDIENRDWHRCWVACSSSCKDKMPHGFPKGVKRPTRQRKYSPLSTAD